MNGHHGKYRVRSQEFNMHFGTNSAVLTQAFVAEALEREERRDDGLNVFRGAINAMLIGLIAWIGLGFLVFKIF